ncbi:MAG: hypothetical protein WAW88_03465 [Nocardioides sp.]
MGGVGVGGYFIGQALEPDAPKQPEETKPTPSPSETPTSRFPGDPGAGSLLLGISLSISEAIADVPELASPPSLTRRFYRAHQTGLMSAMVRADAEAGAVSFVSMKPPGKWSEVAAGDRDGWVDDVLDGLATESPVFLALHHEPENDHSGGGNVPASWREMHVRVATRAARIAPLVQVVPVLMQWTFDPSSKRDPAEWLVDDLPLLGVDMYNPWRADVAGSRWVEFSELLAQVRKAVPDKPIIVPELGAVTDPLDPTRAALWLQSAFDHALTEDVVGMAWFESEYNNRRGDLSLTEEGFAMINALLARPEVARGSDLGT